MVPACKMGGWSTSILAFVAIYHCKANILLISNTPVTIFGSGGSHLKKVKMQGLANFQGGIMKF